jgi:serine/threonine-protein kinase
MYEDWLPIEGANARMDGQGTVTKVRHKVDGRVGARKKLHQRLLHDKERRRMVREVLALQEVQGESIPRVLDHNMESVSQTGAPLFFVSEWIDGPTLQQYVGDRPRSVDEALKVTRDLAAIIRRCHEVGVYHRDIKPDNVIIDQITITPILVDFGTAWARAEPIDSQLQTETGQELGNRFLRISDLAAGREKRDPRADITLLVGILFFMLTGAYPRVLMNENGRPPHEALANTIPETVVSDPRWSRLQRIFHVGFQPDVDQRFQTTDDLIQYINEVRNPMNSQEPMGGLEAALTTFDELSRTTIVQSMQEIERAMLQASKNLENRLETMANDNGLMSRHLAGGGRVSVGGRDVEFSYGLCRIEAWDPEATVLHRVELVGENRSFVKAEYRIEARVGDTRETGHHHETYYRGPAADTDRLTEELVAHAEEIFVRALNVLGEKIEEVARGPNA